MRTESLQSDIFVKIPVNTADGIKYLFYSLIMWIVVSIMISIVVIANYFGSYSISGGVSCLSGLLSLIWIVLLIIGALKIMYGRNEINIKEHSKNAILTAVFTVLIVIILLISFVYSFLVLWSVFYNIFQASQGNVTLDQASKQQLVSNIRLMFIVQAVLSFLEAIFIGLTYFFSIKSLIKKISYVMLALILIIASSTVGLFSFITIVYPAVDRIFSEMMTANNTTDIYNYINATLSEIEKLQALSNIPLVFGCIGYFIILVEFIRVKKMLDTAIKDLKPSLESTVVGDLKDTSDIDEKYEESLEKIICPYCDYPFEIAKSLIHHDIQCPRCGSKFRIKEE